MKVLHVIPSVSETQGGPSFALRTMVEGLAALGVQVDVATTDDDGPGRRLEVPLGRPVIRDGAGYFYFSKQTEFYKSSWPFARWVRRHVSDYDLLHIHALFSFTSVSAARAARYQRVPYIIRPLGVLSNWSRRHRRPWLKSISLQTVEQPILRHASAIHYTSRQEQLEAEAISAWSRGEVIPLGIDVAGFENLPDPGEFFARHPSAAGRPVVLFLSRLDPKKGLDLLLPAFAQLISVHTRAVLAIAGDGDAAFVDTCRREAVRLGIDDRVIWCGFIAGREKLAALAAATVFVLPSYSENFGIALVEALAAGRACVLSDKVGIAAEIDEAGAGLIVACQSSALAAALERLLGDHVLRARLAANARVLAAGRFSTAVASQRLKDLYAEVRRAHPPAQYRELTSATGNHPANPDA